MTALVSPTGRFDRAAITTRAQEFYAAQSWIVQKSSGDAKRWWRERLWADAMAKAWRQAKEARHDMIFAHVRADYGLTPAERAEVASLEAYQKSRPINPLGNEDFVEASRKAAAIRERAMRRKYRMVERGLSAGRRLALSTPAEA